MLHASGLTDQEIAKAMGLTRATVCYRRKCYALPPNPRIPESDPCITCYSRSVCQSGACQEKRAWEAGE